MYLVFYNLYVLYICDGLRVQLAGFETHMEDVVHSYLIAGCDWSWIGVQQTPGNIQPPGGQVLPNKTCNVWLRLLERLNVRVHYGHGHRMSYSRHDFPRSHMHRERKTPGCLAKPARHTNKNTSSHAEELCLPCGHEKGGTQPGLWTVQVHIYTERIWKQEKLAVKMISLCVRACILWHLPLRFREFQHVQTWPIFIHFQFVTWFLES